MEFFPLTLGLQGRPIERVMGRREEPKALRLADWAWHEWLGGPERDEDTYPADNLVRRLAQSDKVLPARPWVILGEPGAGKTSLLEHWYATWPQPSPKSRPGVRLPVLLRLRDLTRAALAGDPASIVDELREQGLTASQSKTGNAMPTTEALQAPVWLLDGLDELVVPVGDRGFWEAVRALPGDVVLTCRTAAFRMARAGVAGQVRSVWRILNLHPDRDQEAFLAQAYAAEGWSSAGAGAVVRELNTNAALRPLAAIPALLRLLGAAGPGLPLPAARGAFHKAMTDALWARHAGGQETGTTTSQPGPVLVRLAELMDLGTLDAPLNSLEQAGATSELRNALRRSGLLRFDAGRNRISFPHLTLQEFHLARAWLQCPFGEVLRDCWASPRHEEALALLIFLHAEEGRAALIEAELRAFVAKARADHARDPQRLRSVGRSPLRTALHLLERAATPEIALPLALPAEHMPLRLAAAYDRRMPPAALAVLADDEHWWVRRAVAENPATPAATLARLASDEKLLVRTAVAENHAAPPSALARLADDEEHWLRARVARHAATMPAVLAKLASDESDRVRHAVGGNPATPLVTLVGLTSDSDQSVLHMAVLNSAMSPATLAALAGHDDDRVRKNVARNRTTPPAVLAMLASDGNRWVRSEVARNPQTPPEALARLARDEDTTVRFGVAENPGTLPETLAGLTDDKDWQVLIRVAANAATPVATLVRLAGSKDWRAVSGVAKNIATPADVLVRLAEGGDEHVRVSAAGNAATPPATLAKLAIDVSPDVRRALAWNPATPKAALTMLAGDEDPWVRLMTAENTIVPQATLVELATCGHPSEQFRVRVAKNDATPLEALANLASDEHWRPREAVAENAITPPSVLAMLANDGEWIVREAVARNAAIPPAILANLTGDDHPGVQWAALANTALLFEDLLA